MLKAFFLIFLLPLLSFAQLTISPAPVNNEIDLDSTSATIYFANPNNTSVIMNLSLQNVPGFSMGINRCAGKTLLRNQNCYVVINVNDSLLANGVNSALLSNSGSPLVTFNRTKIQGSGSSIFTQASPIVINDFTIRSITIQNLTPTVRNYVPVLSGPDASKYSIVLNRCQSVGVGKTCTVSVQMSPQQAGSYTATITEPQVTGSLTLNSTITSSTVGVVQPPVLTVSASPLSLNFGTLINYGQSILKYNVTVTNTGNTALTPIINLSSRVRMIMNRCTSILVPGKSCSITVTFFVSTDSEPVNNFTNDLIQIKATAQSTSIDIPVLASTNIVLYCAPGTHQEKSVCVSDIANSGSRACSIIPNGQVGGIEFFDNNSNDWSGFCSARSQADCSPGWTYNALAQSCLTTQMGTINIGNLPTGYSLVHDVREFMSYGNPYAVAHNACLVTSVNPTFSGRRYEVLNSSALAINSTDCNSIPTAVLTNSVRVIDNYDSCELRLTTAGKKFLLAKPTSLDPNFCYNLNLSSAIMQSGHKTQYDLFGANPIQLTEFDGRVFYLREMAPLQTTPHNRILSSTNGISGNSIDHSSNNYSIKAIKKFDNKLYVIAEALVATSGHRTNYLFRLDNSSQNINQFSVPLFSGQSISLLMVIDDILVIAGEADYYYSPVNYIGFIQSGSTTVTKLINNDRDFMVSNPNNNSELVSESDFVKVGNKLYARNPFSEFAGYFDQNSVYYNQIYDVYDLTTGQGGIALNLETINPDPNAGWNTKVFSVGSKKYAMLNEKLYEIDPATQNLTLLNTFQTLMSDMWFGAPGTAYINTYASDYSVGFLHKLTSSSNTISLVSNNFPFWSHLFYNEINGKMFLAQDGSYTPQEIDDAGNISTIPSSNEVFLNYPMVKVGTKYIFTGDRYSGTTRLFVYENGSISQLPDLCVDRANNMSVNSYGRKYNIYYRNFGGMINFNNSVLFPGNSCQNEANAYDIYGNDGTLYELYKYTP